MNTMQVLLIVSAMVLALHMTEAMNFRNKRAASVALEDYLATQVLMADEEEAQARARSNANVQSGISQYGQYNSNAQSGIQQHRRAAAAAARRQNANAQSGVAQSGGNNNNAQSGVQQGGPAAPAPHAALAAYLSSRKAPNPYKIASSLN